MTITQILSYVLFLAILAFTLFNIYATMTSKKRRKMSEQSFQTEMAPIEKALLDYQKTRGLRYDTVKRLMNDQGQGIFIVYDSKNGVGAIAMKDSTIHFKKDELKDAEQHYETISKRKVKSAAVEVRISDDTYVYKIGTKEFNPRGMIGRVVRETTEEMTETLKEIISL